MSIKSRVQKLEGASAGFNLKHTLLRDISPIRAANGESLLDAVERAAKDSGLMVDQVGYAMVEFPDGRVEEYQTVPDPWNLHGWLRHEEVLQILESGVLDKTKKLFADELRLTPEEFEERVDGSKRFIEIRRRHESKATATRDGA